MIGSYLPMGVVYLTYTILRMRVTKIKRPLPRGYKIGVYDSIYLPAIDQSD